MVETLFRLVCDRCLTSVLFEAPPGDDRIPHARRARQLARVAGWSWPHQREDICPVCTELENLP